MPGASIDGLESLEARLDSLPAALGAALMAKAQTLADALADKIRSDKLSGQILNVRSGALRASIEASVASDGDGISATVGSVGDVKYAAIQEYGGKTAAHEILPAKAQALAFLEGGALRFAHRVEHPGSIIPERSYLRSSLEEMSAGILAALEAAAQQAWEQT